MLCNGPQMSQRKSLGRNNSLTFTMFAVCFVFGLTILPGEIVFFTTSISKLLGTDFVFHDSLFFFIIYKMDYLNHGMNFILYCVTGSVFRQTLVRIFTCTKSRISTRRAREQCSTVQETRL